MGYGNPGVYGFPEKRGFRILGLYPPTLREGDGRTFPDHNVVEHTDVDEGEGLFQALRDLAVSRAWFRISGRVVVRENQGRRVQGKRQFGDFPGVYSTGVNRSCEQRFVADEIVLGVQEQPMEFLVGQVGETGVEVGFDQLWTGQVGFLGGITLAEFPNGFEKLRKCSDSGQFERFGIRDFGDSHGLLLLG